MARENFVFLHGQVFDKPRVYVDGNGVQKKASLAIRVIRRPFISGEGAVTSGKLSIDIPTIMTMNPELVRICSDLRKGDMIDIRGVYTTREVKKKSTCPNGHENVWAGNFVFVTPIYICRREQELSEEEGMKLLRERSEISNLVMLIGTLCREPVLRESSEGQRTTALAQYQLASNRRYHIRDGHEQERTDYPWIKTINKQAREDMEHLHTNSAVFINGAIQTREIEREITCDVCGETYTIKESVCEIFPYSVEYLMNCVFPVKENPESGETDATITDDGASGKE